MLSKIIDKCYYCKPDKTSVYYGKTIFNIPICGFITEIIVKNSPLGFKLELNPPGFSNSDVHPHEEFNAESTQNYQGHYIINLETEEFTTRQGHLYSYLKKSNNGKEIYGLERDSNESLYIVFQGNLCKEILNDIVIIIKTKTTVEHVKVNETIVN